MANVNLRGVLHSLGRRSALTPDVVVAYLQTVGIAITRDEAALELSACGFVEDDDGVCRAPQVELERKVAELEAFARDAVKLALNAGEQVGQLDAQLATLQERTATPAAVTSVQEQAAALSARYKAYSRPPS